MRRVRRLFIAALALAILAPTAFAAQSTEFAEKLKRLSLIRGKYSFIVLGDNRSGDAAYRNIIARAMERKPDFIVNVGDQIPDPGDRDDWDRFWALSKPITVPYFLTVGNHDVNDRKSEKIYREQVDLPGNELYYRFRVGTGSLFIVLDSFLTGEQKRITGEQYQWLKKAMGDAREHIFVFLHHPLYSEKSIGRHYGRSLDQYPAERDRLQRLFSTHGVDVVFAGHEHLYRRKEVGIVTHIITGGAGAPVYAKDEDGGFYHFIHVTVDGKKVTGEVVDSNGKVRDRFAL